VVAVVAVVAVQAVNKKKTRLNCIAHLLEQFAHHGVSRPEVVLPAWVRNPDYLRQPELHGTIVPERY